MLWLQRINVAYEKDSKAISGDHFDKCYHASKGRLLPHTIPHMTGKTGSIGSVKDVITCEGVNLTFVSCLLISINCSFFFPTDGLGEDPQVSHGHGKILQICSIIRVHALVEWSGCLTYKVVVPQGNM